LGLNLTSLVLTSSAVTGDVSAWSVKDDFTYLDLHGNNLTGDISALITMTSLTYLDLSDNGVMSFDSSTAWAGHDHDCNFSDAFIVVDSTSVDNALIALSGGDFSGRTINLGGSNPARTSASDAALAILEANNTVIVNE
jgi:hypothetical protein